MKNSTGGSSHLFIGLQDPVLLPACFPLYGMPVPCTVCSETMGLVLEAEEYPSFKGCFTLIGPTVCCIVDLGLGSHWGADEMHFRGGRGCPIFIGLLQNPGVMGSACLGCMENDRRVSIHVWVICFRGDPSLHSIFLPLSHTHLLQPP